MTKCQVPHCRQSSDLLYKGRDICLKCWGRHCDKKIDLNIKLKIKVELEKQKEFIKKGMEIMRLLSAITAGLWAGLKCLYGFDWRNYVD